MAKSKIKKSEVFEYSAETLGAIVLQRFGNIRILVTNNGLVSDVIQTLPTTDKPKYRISSVCVVSSNNQTQTIGIGVIEITNAGVVRIILNGTDQVESTYRVRGSAVWVV